MKRLRQIRDYLAESGNLDKAVFTLHVLESEIVPVEQETAEGVHLFDDKCNAVIFIDDVTEAQYENLKLLLYDWFRENGDENETYRLSADQISDTLHLVSVDLDLIDATHMAPDVTGPIERDETRYKLEEETPTYDTL